MYLYILDTADKPLGVIDIKELHMAQDDVLLKDFMTDKVVSLGPDSTLKQAAGMFARYGFRTLPVTDT